MVATTQPVRSAPRRRRRLFGALGIGLVVASAAACNVPQRYDVATVAEGLSNPWDASFAPDGSLFFTERVGDINVLRAGGAVTTFDGPTDVVAQGEGGMMGIAVDPEFATNRHIYTCYLTSGDVRVVRFTVSADYTSLSEQTPLVTGIPRTSGRHSGCRTRFGPEPGGVLWITTGDSAQSGLSQSPTSLGGKVLRINTDGSPAAGNMAAPFLPQIFAYGFRNPQGISWRPTDNQSYLIEHGPTCEDEITALRVGGNGGWDPGPGYNESVPMTDLNKFPDALRPAWSSGCPTIAPSGGTFVTSSLWGARSGQMAMAVLKGQQLRLINLADGQGDPGGGILIDQGRVREAVEGPDGLLYVLIDANPGRIIQVTPVL